MALTPEQIARQIEGIGTDLPITLQEAINTAAQTALDAIKSRAPIDTGNLRNSMSVSVNDDLTLGISMVDYGFFQNYGVKGTKNTKSQLGVPVNVQNVLPPRTGDTYSFNPENRMIGGNLPFGVRVSIHRNGLDAKGFLDLESFITQVANIVNQNLEL